MFYKCIGWQSFSLSRLSSWRSASANVFPIVEMPNCLCVATKHQLSWTLNGMETNACWVKTKDHCLLDRMLFEWFVNWHFEPTTLFFLVHLSTVGCWGLKIVFCFAVVIIEGHFVYYLWSKAVLLQQSVSKNTTIHCGYVYWPPVFWQGC